MILTQVSAQSLLLLILSAAPGQSTTTPSFKLPATLVSSVTSTDLECRNWLFRLAQLNSGHCSRRIIDLPDSDTLLSIHGVPHETWTDTTKLTDGTYQCKVMWPWNGCSNQFLAWFQTLTFSILCPRIDGIDTILEMSSLQCSDNQNIAPSSSRNQCIETIMRCTKQQYHDVLVAERQVLVDQARTILTDRLGLDVMTSCIDHHL